MWKLSSILNENIEWNCMQIEWNFNSTIQFTSWMKIWFNWIQIQLKINGMQIGAKGIKNLLVNMVLEKKRL
jgi:hypothetical protein